MKTFFTSFASQTYKAYYTGIVLTKAAKLATRSQQNVYTQKIGIDM